MTKYLLVIVLLALFGYGLVEGWPLIEGPQLSVTTPLDGASVTGGIVGITGKSAHAALLTLNGAPLLHEEDGSFVSTLTFPSGGSILTFVATDRFGRRITITRNIFVP